MDVPEGVDTFNVTFAKTDDNSIWAASNVSPNTSQNHPVNAQYVYLGGVTQSEGGQWRPTEGMLHAEDYTYTVDMSDANITKAIVFASIYNGTAKKTTKITFHRVSE